jgi:tRNA-specific 2-thiouridylase
LKKDQTYFLYQVKREQLPKVLFPVGDFLKSEVREKALELGLSVADKKDSVGICFVGDVNVHSILEEKFGKRLGKVFLTDGTEFGEHDGYWFFTIGQRGGYRKYAQVASARFESDEMPKLYVVAIDKDKNEVVVGTRAEGEQREFVLSDVSWVGGGEDGASDGLPPDKRDVFVKVRNLGDFVPVEIESGDKGLKVKLKRPVYGVSSGQSVVIYRNIGENKYLVLGGGVVSWYK